MGAGLTLIVITALLATPVGVLIGAAAGAGLTYRLMKGLAPLPPIPAGLTRRRKVSVVEPGQDAAGKPHRPPLPDVGA
jgi:hypothetical protein